MAAPRSWEKACAILEEESGSAILHGTAEHHRRLKGNFQTTCKSYPDTMGKYTFSDSLAHYATEATKCTVAERSRPLHTANELWDAVEKLDPLADLGQGARDLYDLLNSPRWGLVPIGRVFDFEMYAGLQAGS